jgi:hypothetical protein
MTKYAGFARAGVCAALLLSVCAFARPADGLIISSVRYAGPHGSGTDCFRTNPCDIVEAINNSPSNLEVVLEPGVYGSPGSPITTPLSDETTDSLNIHGQAGAPNPLVYSSANNAISLTNESSLAHLSIVASGSGGAVLVDGRDANHLAVVATAASGFACSVFGDLSDSLCVDTGANGAAVELESEASGSVTAFLDNVTAIATNGTGILAAAATGAHLTVGPTDSIIRGTQQDVDASADSGASVDVDVNHCAFRSGHSSAVDPAAIHNQGGNTSSDPRFVKASAGDFREAAGSPTIDKGLQRVGHPTDLAGNPRNLGKANDMGAYEFLPKPQVGKIHVSRKTAHSVKVKVGVNPDGLATAVRLIARHGHGHKTSHRVQTGDGKSSRSLQLKVRGLKAGTKYHLVVKATNAGGTKTSHGKSVTTKGKSKPKHKHHHHASLTAREVTRRPG